MRIKLITTASDLSHPGWLNLKKSLDKFGWDYEVLNTDYVAFGTKMVNAYHFAKNNNYTHLFIIDAYDVIALGTMEEALSRIKNHNCLLWNSERNAWPYEQWAMLYPDARSSFKYLNGGMAFVEVERFCRMFEENPITVHDNDQVVLGKTFLTRGAEYDMKLDTRCSIFQTLCSTNWDEFEFLGELVRNKETNTVPVLFHGNGLHPMDKLIELI